MHTTNSIGLRGVYRSEIRPPRISPSASAAEIAPHAAAPPRCALATTGPSTMNAPFQAIMTRQYWITVAHSQVCLVNSAHPSRSSAIMPGSSAGAWRGRRPPLTASISGTVPDMPTAHSVSAQPGPATATSRPATAAPVIWPDVHREPADRAALLQQRVRHELGEQRLRGRVEHGAADSGDRLKADHRPQRRMPRHQHEQAEHALADDHGEVPAMITRCGRNRSANTPLTSENTSIGAVWAAIT